MLVVVITVVFVGFRLTKNGNYLIKEIDRETLSQTVDVSGKVIPLEDVKLSFEVSGRVVKNNFGIGDKVKRGALIAEIDKSKILADISRAKADVQVSQIEVNELADTEGSNRILNERSSTVSTLKNAYTSADIAVRNKTDQMFENPGFANAKVTLAIDDYELRQDIEKERVDIGKLLNKWNQRMLELNSVNLEISDITETLINLNMVRDYLRLLEGGLGDSSPIGSVTSSTIGTYRTDLASARNTVDTAIESVDSVNENLRDVTSDLPIKQAKLSSKEAELDSLLAQLDDYSIVAPFDGVVTKNDLTVGQIVAANESLISLITQGDLEIEAFVPEINIANVKIGDAVDFALDAFGPEKFGGFVASIDPSETIDDGVSTYRILIGINPSPESVRIKSGMTADISIYTLTKEDVILVPVSSIFAESGKSFVYLKKDKDIEKREVVLGQKDSYGNQEVLDGLSVGDLVILNYQE